MNPSIGLMWFRRDLRLTDDPAWSTATSEHDQVTAIHAPWEAGPLDLAATGVTLGDTYPEPIVDHADAGVRALAAYRAAGAA